MIALREDRQELLEDLSLIISYLFFLDISVQGGKVHEVIPM